MPGLHTSRAYSIRGTDLSETNVSIDDLHVDCAHSVIGNRMSIFAVDRYGGRRSIRILKRCVRSFERGNKTISVPCYALASIFFRAVERRHQYRPDQNANDVLAVRLCACSISQFTQGRVCVSLPMSTITSAVAQEILHPQQTPHSFLFDQTLPQSLLPFWIRANRAVPERRSPSDIEKARSFGRHRCRLCENDWMKTCSRLLSGVIS